SVPTRFSQRKTRDTSGRHSADVSPRTANTIRPMPHQNGASSAIVLQVAVAIVASLRDSPTHAQRQHESRQPAEEHADRDQRAYYPRRARRPAVPDQYGEQHGDDAVEQEPPTSWKRPERESLDEFKRSFEHEIDRQREGECLETEYRLCEQVVSDGSVKNRD